MAEFTLTPGSRYRVTSVRTREDTLETEGVFRGVTSMGSVDAMVLETDEDGDDDGRRLIPTHVVLQVEVLEQVGGDELDDEDSAMFT